MLCVPGVKEKYFHPEADIMATQDNFIFGIHAVKEAISAGKDIDKVLIRRGGGSDLFKELLAEIPIRPQSRKGFV